MQRCGRRRCVCVFIIWLREEILGGVTLIQGVDFWWAVIWSSFGFEGFTFWLVSCAVVVVIVIGWRIIIRYLIMMTIIILFHLLNSLSNILWILLSLVIIRYKLPVTTTATTILQYLRIYKGLSYRVIITILSSDRDSTQINVLKIAQAIINHRTCIDGIIKWVPWCSSCSSHKLRRL